MWHKRKQRKKIKKKNASIEGGEQREHGHKTRLERKKERQGRACWKTGFSHQKTPHFPSLVGLADCLVLVGLNARMHACPLFHFILLFLFFSSSILTTYHSDSIYLIRATLLVRWALFFVVHFTLRYACYCSFFLRISLVFVFRYVYGPKMTAPLLLNVVIDVKATPSTLSMQQGVLEGQRWAYFWVEDLVLPRPSFSTPHYTIVSWLYYPTGLRHFRRCWTIKIRIDVRSFPPPLSLIFFRSG